MFGRCARQAEVQATLRAGQWPQGCDAELRAHVASCRECGDLALVAGAFQQARAADIARAPQDSPGALWWRAQVQRRKGAVERMSRPIVVAEWIAFTCALIGLGISLWQWGRSAWSGTWSGLTNLASAAAPAGVPATSGWLVLSLAIVAVVVIFGGVAVYLVSSRD